MKLLIMSDSHGHDEKLVDLILEHPEADAVIFLGDGEWDFENAVKVCDAKNRKLICHVKGNCDLASLEPDTIVREFAGIRILITHGHEQNVKCGIWGLVDEAKSRNCTVALFGHTHRQTVLEREGILLMNPGSAAEGKCGILEIRDGILNPELLSSK